MPIETINFAGTDYPKWQSEGNAAQFAIPFAKQALKYCQTIYDVGCNRTEWMYPGAIPIDPALDPRYNALCFPVTSNKPDGIFSSHCLEHVSNWVAVLDYWHAQLCKGGVMVLYLPDHSQKYWRPWNNRKHLHLFTPEIVGSYFRDQPEMWCNVFVSGIDLNNSFMIVAQKK